MYWEGWTLDRIVILFIGLAFLLIGIQVTMFHYRQNFHHKSMWLPVIASPVFFVAGTALAMYNVPWLVNTFIVLMLIGIIDGLIGLYYHFRGVGVRVGGWAGRNFLIGPPIIMPIIFTALSALGLIAVFW